MYFSMTALAVLDSVSAKKSSILIVTGLVSLFLISLTPAFLFSTAPEFALLFAPGVEFEPLPLDTAPEPQADNMDAAMISPPTAKQLKILSAFIIISLLPLNFCGLLKSGSADTVFRLNTVARMF
jgi:hypothetical protein